MLSIKRSSLPLLFPTMWWDYKGFQEKLCYTTYIYKQLLSPYNVRKCALTELLRRLLRDLYEAMQEEKKIFVRLIETKINWSKSNCPLNAVQSIERSYK